MKEIIKLIKKELNRTINFSRIKQKFIDYGIYEEFIISQKNLFGELSEKELVFLGLNYNYKPKCDKNFDIKFINFIKKYQFCGEICECRNKSKSIKMILSNSEKTKEEKELKKQKMKQILLEKYGVDNFFKTEEFKELSKKTCIEKYGVENARQSKEIQNKIKNTCIERYGFDNPAKNKEIQDKMKNTCIERYGVSNPYKLDKIREKGKNTCIERYGVDNPFKSKEVIDKIRITLREKYFDNINNRVKNLLTPCFTEYEGVDKSYEWICNTCSNLVTGVLVNGSIPRCYNCFPKTVSNPELEIRNWLHSNNINFISSDRTILNGKELDIVIPDFNLAIEYCGIYWHSEKQGKDKNYHIHKLEESAKKDIKLITIFGDEFINSSKVYSRLSSLLKINQNIVYARKCEIKKVSNKDMIIFLEENHLMGSKSASIRLGLYYNDELISVMTFSKPNFHKTEYEMVRYCSNKSVVGGAKKLFQYFIKEYSPNSIISFADRRWSTGDLYYKLGFNLKNISTPGYWYLDTNMIRHHRLKFTKKNLIKQGHDPNLTEWEIMQSLGYDRIWDCGQLLFKWVK